MSTIVTRAGKGAALTWTEGDANITNLNNDKIEAVVDDTAPELGGDLDVNGHKITATSGNIELDPGAGNIVLDGLTWPVPAGGGGGGGGSISGTISSSSSATNRLSLDTTAGMSIGNSITFTGTDISTIGLGMGSYYLIDIWPLSNEIQVSMTMGGAAQSLNTGIGYTDAHFQVTSGGGGGGGGTDQYLAYNSGTSSLSWTTPSTPSSNLSSLTDVMVTGATTGQVLTYDGSTMKWKNQNAASGGLTDIVQDTTPQLGGNLDINGNKIVSTSNGNIALEPNGSGKVTATANIETTGDVKAKELFSNNSTGDEGGQINLAKPATGTSISGTGVIIDVYQNKLRIFEEGGSARGAYIDLTTAGTSVGTNLLAGGGSSFDPASPGAIGGTTPNSGTFTSLVTTTDGLVSLNSGGSGNMDNVHIGGTTPASGIFTTLTASSTVSGTGFSTYLASPPAIGSTTASTGKFTSLTTTGSVNLTGNATVNINGGTTGNINIRASSTLSDATHATLFLLNGSTSTMDGVSIGSGVAMPGAFTTLSASSTVSGTGFTNRFASPGPIGSTVASTGKFTSLQFTNTIEPTYALTYAATLTPDAANGSIQKVTLTGAVTISSFATPVAGESITLIITQDATGSRLLTSTMKFAGGIKTLSTAANSIDIMTVYYDGTTYYASLAKGFA